MTRSSTPLRLIDTNNFASLLGLQHRPWHGAHGRANSLWFGVVNHTDSAAELAWSSPFKLRLGPLSTPSGRYKCGYESWPLRQSREEPPPSFAQSFAQPSNFVLLWPMHAFCTKYQGAKPAHIHILACSKSLHSSWITIKSVQGPCTALLELINGANLARTYGSRP